MAKKLKKAPKAKASTLAQDVAEIVERGKRYLALKESLVSAMHATGAGFMRGSIHDPGYAAATQKKPILGLMPRFLHMEHRVKDILDACSRYAAAGMPIKLEWIDELYSLVEELESK